MGGASIWHWVVVGGIVMLLFGRGKISEMMGDVAKGIKAFKKGMSDDETTAAATPASTVPTNDPLRTLEGRPIDPAPASTVPLADRPLADRPMADRKVG